MANKFWNNEDCSSEALVLFIFRFLSIFNKLFCIILSTHNKPLYEAAQG